MKISSIFTIKQAEQLNDSEKSSSVNCNNNISTNKLELLAQIPEKRDLVSFKAIKKSQLKGFDLAIIERVKAPLQNFRDLEHIQNWAGTRFLSLGFEKIKARTRTGILERKSILNEWYKYLETENNAYPNTLKFLIYSSLIAGLADNDDKLPPKLNKGVLADTVYQLEKELEKNPKYQFNFNKIYQDNFKKLELKSENVAFDATGWIVIPSFKNDPENFIKNVEKLQSLSHDNWCTKSYNAEPYLKEGDFHIYLENGKPKLGVRFNGDYVVEVQGEENNSKIPGKYFETFKAHRQECKFELSGQAKEETERIEKFEPLIKKIKEDLGENFEIKTSDDAEKILDYFEIKYQKDSENLLVIPEYSQKTFRNISLSDIGVKEEDLWKHISKIEGDADFSNCQLKTFDKLTEIGGNVLLDNYAIIESFGSLKKIGGNLILKECYLDSLGNLEYIGGDFVNQCEYIRGFDNIKEIGGNVDFSEFEYIDSIEKVGGNAKFKGAKHKDPGSLKRVDGNVIFEEAWLDNLKDLEYIGGNMIIEGADIGSFGSLKTVKGNVEIRESRIDDFGELEVIGKDLIIEDSHNLKYTINDSKLKKINGDVYLEETDVSEYNFGDIVKGETYDEDCEKYNDIF